MHPRRTFLRRLGASTGLLLLGPTSQDQVLASDEPLHQLQGKVIRWIVPHAPGGGFDAYARLIEPFLERTIHAEVIVENVPGAGGIVGARTIMRARADGLTLGILDAPGLLVAAMADETVPHVVKDFAVLGRVARSRQIWATGSRSGFQTIGDLLEVARHRPVVVGITDVGTTQFVNAAVGSHLLGIDVSFVPGYKGVSIASLAAVRGEVDLVVYNFESILNIIEDGDLRPLLQVSDEPIAAHPSLAHVPLLGGDQGFAVRRAAELGGDVKVARMNAGALANMVGAGRLIVAPSGLEERLSRQLEHALYETLTNPEFAAAAARARWSLDVAGAEEALADLQAGAEGVKKFMTTVRKAIKYVRE